MSHLVLKKSLKVFSWSSLCCLSIALSSPANAIVEQTNGYLAETKVALPPMEQNFGKLVFVRVAAVNKNIPTLFINERVVGSLPPLRYSQTLVCPGKQNIRIDTRLANINKGETDSVTVNANEQKFIQVLESGDVNFVTNEISQQDFDNLLGKVTQSHIINRHFPVCEKPVVVPPVTKKLEIVKSVNLGADALFKFDSTVMLPEGRLKIEELMRDIETLGVQIEQIRIVGHTDRLGSIAYNEKLSLRRAVAVSNYMKGLGLDIETIEEGHGEMEPVTTGCVGTKKTKALVDCLQPDRRVTIELLGFTVETEIVEVETEASGNE